MEVEMLKEQQKTNELLEELIKQNKYENELLTIKDVVREYKIGEIMVRKMFNDPKLAVQRYTSPFKVTRKALNEYMATRHDYLCNSKY